MKIFKKRPDRSPSSPHNLPGTFTILRTVHTVVVQDRMIFAGYAAWSILPALATFGVSFITLSPLFHFLITNSILIGDLLLGVWVGACLMLVGMAKIRQEPFAEQEISTRARKAIPLLLYLFAFSLFCTLAGIYLLLIPGVLAFIWLAFTPVVALEKPGISFSRAIAESRLMSKGKFFPVLWRLALGNIVFGVCYFALFFVVLGGICIVAGMNPQELLASTFAPQASFPAWLSLLFSSLSLPLMPYSAVYTVALYDALKTR